MRVGAFCGRILPAHLIVTVQYSPPHQNCQIYDSAVGELDLQRLRFKCWRMTPPVTILCRVSPSSLKESRSRANPRVFASTKAVHVRTPISAHWIQLRRSIGLATE